MRIGVMTCALDEVACLAFTVGALIDLVDLYVFLDTGSQDGTLELLQEIYPRAIREGRLVVEQIGRLPDYDMSIARNRALEILRQHDIDYFVRADADDVFYDAGAQKLIAYARQFPKHIPHLSPGEVVLNALSWITHRRPNHITHVSPAEAALNTVGWVTGRLPNQVTQVSCLHHELYQWEAFDTLEWLESIRLRRDIFWEMDFVPYNVRLLAVEGAYAHGKWCDEAANLSPERVRHDQAYRVGIWETLMAHYGWAHPVQKKQAKSAAWYGDPDRDLRVERLHLVKDKRRPKKRFYRHPEIFERQIDAVIEFVSSWPK